MVIITYSQQKLKPIFQNRISRIFNIVKTCSTPDLWIKVFIYRSNRYNPSSGLNWDRDGPQIEFYFGNRFKFQDIWKFSNWKRWRGHYRYAEVGGHGFYDKEWKFLEKHSNIKHVITLKFSEDEDDIEIAKLIAHEFRHYLQFRKYGISMESIGNNGKRTRPIQVEADANKWTKKRMEQIRDLI